MQLLFFISFLLSVFCFANTQDLEKAFAQKNYKVVIDKLSPKVESLTAEELLLLSKAYTESGATTLAVKTLNTAVANHPRMTKLKLFLAKAYLDDKNEGLALQLLKDILEVEPKNHDAHEGLLRVYERKGNRYEQRNLYLDMIEKFGEKPIYLNKLCELFTLDAHFDNAKKYCEMAEKKDPKEVMNYIHLARIYQDLGDPEKTEKVFSLLQKDFENNEIAMMSVAEYYDQRHRYNLSWPIYKKYVGKNAQSLKAQTGLAKSSFELQKYQESLDALKMMCKLDNAHTHIFRENLKILEKSKIADWAKKYEKALDDCTRSRHVFY